MPRRSAAESARPNRSMRAAQRRCAHARHDAARTCVIARRCQPHGSTVAAAKAGLRLRLGWAGLGEEHGREGKLCRPKHGAAALWSTHFVACTKNSASSVRARGTEPSTAVAGFRASMASPKRACSCISWQEPTQSLHRTDDPSQVASSIHHGPRHATYLKLHGARSTARTH